MTHQRSYRIRLMALDPLKTLTEMMMKRNSCPAPFQMKMKGITHMAALRPPSRLHAPATPSLENIGTVASGRTVATVDREQDAIAFADAA